MGCSLLCLRSPLFKDNHCKMSGFNGFSGGGDERGGWGKALKEAGGGGGLVGLKG
jgi:hypothetical protein